MVNDERLAELYTATKLRLDAFANGGGSANVLSSEALREAAELYAAAPHDRTAAYCTGLLAWERVAARLDPWETEDVLLALRVFAPWYQHSPEDVPHLLRQALESAVPEQMEPAVQDAPVHPYLLVGPARSLADGTREDVLLGLALLRAAVTLARPDGELAPVLLHDLANFLSLLLKWDGDPRLVEEMLALRRANVARAAEDASRLPTYLHMLGVALAQAYERNGDVDQLDECLAAVGRSVRMSSGTDPQLPARYRAQAQYLLLKHAHSRELNYAMQALASIEWALRLTPEESPGRETYTKVHRQAWEAIGRHVVLPPEESGRATTVLSASPELLGIQGRREEVTGAAATDREGRGVARAGLAFAHRDRWVRMGTAQDLDSAIEQGRTALQEIPKDHELYAECLQVLAFCLLARHRTLSSDDDLDEMLQLEYQLVSVRSSGTATEHSAQLDELANALLMRFDRRRDPADFLEALRHAEHAVTRAPRRSTQRLLAGAFVGGLLLIRRQEAGLLPGDRGDDLDRAVDLLDDAVRGVPAEHDNASVVLQNLALALILRYDEQGRVADLDTAAQRLRSAYDAVEAHPEQRIRAHEPGLLLGEVLYRRWRHRGALSDLDEAVAAAREVMAAVPEQHPHQGEARPLLVRCLLARYGRTGDRVDFYEAGRLARSALASASTDSPRKLTWARADLADALMATSPARTAPDAELLDEAVSLRRQVYEAAPGPKGAFGLAKALYARHETTGVAGPPPGEVVSLLEEALPRAQHPHRTQVLALLGAALREFPHQRQRMRAEECFREVALTPEAPPVERLTSARAWADLLATREAWEQAAEAYRTAIALVPQLASRILARTDREYGLGAAAGLASDAAACLLRTGRADLAMGLWEAGRGVLWEQRMATRGDLAALNEASPELARAYEELRERWNEAERAAPLVNPLAPYAWQDERGTGPRGTSAERHHGRGNEWQSLLEEIRAIDGFSKFPQLPGAHATTHPGVGGPVVALCTSKHGSWAAILHPDHTLTSVPLPGLTPRTAAGHTDRLNDALDRAVDAWLAPEERRAAEREVSAVLAWLWDAVTGPVLAALAYGPLTPEERPPRLWWVPDGALAQLPVHAAGPALSRVCSSYAPTLSALRRAATAAGAPVPLPAGPPRLLAIAMAATPDGTPLDGAAAESQHLAERYGARVLADGEATHDAVCAALPHYELVHFACHSDGSALLLHDHHTRPLTVLEIARLELPRARMAYLSACTTSLGARKLADEALHLAAAFQHAGFPHVIGTLWPVEDGVARSLCGDVYGTLPDLEPTTASVALHRTTRALSERYPQSPSLWAAFVHLGP